MAPGAIVAFRKGCPKRFANWRVILRTLANGCEFLIEKFPLARQAVYATWFHDTNPGETAQTYTVLAIKAVSPKMPTTSLSGAASLRLERIGDWIFAFEPERRISPL
jgi:hypothetical protein